LVAVLVVLSLPFVLLFGFLLLALAHPRRARQLLSKPQRPASSRPVLRVAKIEGEGELEHRLRTLPTGRTTGQCRGYERPPKKFCQLILCVELQSDPVVFEAKLVGEYCHGVLYVALVQVRDDR